MRPSWFSLLASWQVSFWEQQWHASTLGLVLEYSVVFAEQCCGSWRASIEISHEAGDWGTIMEASVQSLDVWRCYDWGLRYVLTAEEVAADSHSTCRARVWVLPSHSDQPIRDESLVSRAS